MSEEVVKDVNFDEPMASKKKINYKEIFLNLLEGDNVVRIVDSHGKKIESHYVPDSTGKPRSVKCPGTGCPVCIKGTVDKNGNRIDAPKQARIFMKVVDKMGTIRILEFGPQIHNQIKRIVADLKAEEPNALITQRDLIINKGPKGSSPLYNVKMVKPSAHPTAQEGLRTQAIEEAVAKDTLDLTEIIKPWAIARINEAIYGIKDESGTDFNFGANVTSNTPVTQTSAPVASEAVRQANHVDDEDLTMFKKK